MISWADVTAIAPDLASVAVGSQAAILADVALSVAAVPWGTKSDLASKYLAAHLGAVTLRGAFGPAGPVQSESVGPASRSYASVPSAASDPFYDLTSYGRRYRQLVRELAPARGPFVL